MIKCLQQEHLTFYGNLLKKSDMMISVILAAGMGKRLRPLTNNIPKPLLEINNVTLLERMIKNCIEVNIFKFIIVVGYNKDKVINFAKYLEKKYKINIEIIENKRFDVTNTSVSTYLASKYIQKNDLDDFLLINGDNVIDPKIINKIASRKSTSMIIDNFKDLNEESFKLIITPKHVSKDNSIVCGIIEEIGKEIDITSSTGEFIGVSKISKDDIGQFNYILEQLINEDEQNYYDFAFKKLSSISNIDFVLTKGLKWTEIDDMNDWHHAQCLIQEFDK